MNKCVFALTLLSCLMSTSLSTAQPPDIIRWTGNTATAQAQGFSQGDPLTLTWGFAATGTHIPSGVGEPSGPNSLDAFLTSIYPGGIAEYKPIVESVFDRWASISGLSYVYEASDDGASFFNNPGILGTRADIRIGGKPIDGNSGVLAYNFFPNGGDMVIDSPDTFYNNTAGGSIRLRNVLAHEHGHGLGMAHVEPDPVTNGTTPTTLMEPFLSLAFDGPQFHDILMANRGYGDFYEKSFGGLGNDVATRATALGTVNNSSPVSIGDDANDLSVAPTENDFVSIDDQSDIDFYSFTLDLDATASILLTPKGPEYLIGPNDNFDGNETLFNSRARSDLTLTLFDTDGSSILATVNENGFGGIEQLTDAELDAGTYFIRVSGLDNPDGTLVDTQFYNLNVSAFSAVPEPGTFGASALIIGVLAFRRRRRA